MALNKCVNCNKKYTPKSVHHLFCGVSCRNKYNAQKTWEAYFKRLIQKTPKRKALTVSILMKLYEEQKGLCALSGVPLTKITGKGKVSTNASLDRIKAGGAYSRQNVRLVCAAVNSFRGALGDVEFKFWCERVTNNG